MTIFNYEDVLRYIVSYKRGHDGVAPTIREIGRQFGISSTAHVHYILTCLEDAGRIRRVEGARGIMVQGGRWDMEQV